MKKFLESILCFFVGHEPGEYLGTRATAPGGEYRCHRCGKIYWWLP